MKNLLKGKRKIVLIVCIVIVIIISFLGIKNYQNRLEIKEETAKIQESAIPIIEKYGLTDITLSFIPTSKHLLYTIQLQCSRLGTLSGDEILALDEELNQIHDVFGVTYDSDGSHYQVSSTTRTVYRDGEKIYDDYINSEIHNSYNEDEGNESGSSVARNDYINRTCDICGKPAYQYQLGDGATYCKEHFEDAAQWYFEQGQ